MWTTILIVIFIVIISLILYDIRRIMELQDLLLKEQFIMRGELNAIVDMASLATQVMPDFKGFNTDEKEDKTTTVEISEDTTH